MKLEILTLEQCEEVRKWRNQCLETLRTPYPLTKEMQESFYQNVVCNRNSPHRYWAIWGEKEDYPAGSAIKVKKGELIVPKIPEFFLGMGGLTGISLENRNAEISLIINPEYRNKGIGKQAVTLLLDQGFNYLNLQTIYGEVYGCNHFEIVEFWKKITEEYTKTNFVNWIVMRNRKFWKGKYYQGYYFTIDRDDFNSVENED